MESDFIEDSHTFQKNKVECVFGMHCDFLFAAIYLSS